MYRRSNWHKNVDFSIRSVENAELEMRHQHKDVENAMEAIFVGKIENWEPNNRLKDNSTGLICIYLEEITQLL
jgi:hypothetical protein